MSLGGYEHPFVLWMMIIDMHDNVGCLVMLVVMWQLGAGRWTGKGDGKEVLINLCCICYWGLSAHGRR